MPLLSLMDFKQIVLLMKQFLRKNDDFMQNTLDLDM